MFKTYTKSLCIPPARNRNYLIIMKLTIAIMITSFQLSAAGFAQNVTLKAKNIPLKHVFTEIKIQTGYDVIFSSHHMFDKAIDVNFVNTPLKEVLSRSLENLPLKFVIEDNSVVIISNETAGTQLNVKGRIINAQGKPIPGARVAVQGTATSVLTNNNGTFAISNVASTAALVISFKGYVTKRVNASADLNNIVLEEIKNASSQIVARGTVNSSSTGETLAGVSVYEKISKKGTTTNNQGQYELNIKPGSVLVFSYIGYVPQEITISSAMPLQIALADDTKSLQDVVVIGYATVRKKDLTGAVGQVNLEDLAKAPVGNFAEALAGRVAGVQVISNDGQPGGGFDIMIRGAGSLTQSTSPLYVIDGFPVEGLDPSTLNTDDIESLTVLKDASSTAIYGSRAGNGVVLIETKRGNVGKPVVNFTTSYGYQMQAKQMELMSPYEFLKYQVEINPTLQRTRSYFTNGRTLEDYRNIEGIDWNDQVMTRGQIQKYNLSLRGGNRETQYSISGSLFDQLGTIVNTGYNRYNGRVTVDQLISNKIKVGVTANYSKVETNGHVINTGAGSSNPSSYILFRTWGFRPVHHDENVDLVSEDVDEENMLDTDFRSNPFIDLENQHSINRTNTIDGNAYLNYSVIPSLTFRTTLGFRHSRGVSERFYNSKTTQGNPGNPRNLNGIHGSISNANAERFSNENTLTWRKTLNKDHKITGLGLVSFNSSDTFSNGYGGRLLPNENLGIDGLDEGITYNPSSVKSQNRMISYATRWDYGYKSKYLLTLNFRADGSSKFVNPWGYFPGAAIAWNMDSEPFFKNAFPFVSTSKIRASYGSTGNNRVGDYDTYASLEQSLNGYSFNNEAPMGAVYVSAMGNTDLQWEKVNTIDLGYELGLFKNRVNLEFDLYRRTTEDLLLRATLPPSTGFGNAMKNIGKLKNEGLEFTMNTTNVKNRNFSWSSSFNISFNKNTILELADGEQSLPTTVAFDTNFSKPLYLAEVGKAAGMMIGFLWEGNYQYEHFNNPSPGVYVLKPDVPTNGAAAGTIQPGDIKYTDINGDGIVNDNDLAVIGRGQPLHTGGFSNNLSYKGFDLNIFFQWAYGNDLYNANRISMEGNSNIRSNLNQFASYVNRWSPENPTNENYRGRGQGLIGYHSSKVVEDGSYLRLKTVSLSYAIPQQWIKKAYLTRLSLNLSAQNLFTWTNYTGVDPEVSTRNNVLSPGFDFSAYPQARTIAFGLNATF